ncbi:DUF2167 domain-containing protein [Sphingomonas donggukensis]|uniref:DUF2167 domain-containing protein n=1 Tax=Sphingomonas donggukensis TaxID=2949093 RepID=A0ABY4TY79_9SPHN|nr:DUF2167 domain-containing protein [Sphingomonas donggukensis]URW75501.1 DUF2167 domain-containing protein [Sphingomonas donggukensis]
MKFWMVLGIALAAVPATAQAPKTAPAVAVPTAAEQAAQFAAFEKSLHPQSGDVAIPAASAVLRLGKDYYFLPAEDAKRVLTQVWGNPPDGVADVLGMVLPAGKTAFDNVWGAVVTYEDTGYVSDADAADQDYDEVLKQSRDAAEETSAARRKEGYAGVRLVGWAQPPAYDARSHALIWARDLKFDGSKVDSLNYDVRLLGRRGVLSLNMVSDMAHLPEVKAAAEQFGRTAAFTPGSRYADFDSSTDKKAEFGLAGLVAAGVGVAAAKKLGLLAILLGFGKKFIILLVLAGGAILRWGRRLFGRNEEPADEVAEAEPQADRS